MQLVPPPPQHAEIGTVSLPASSRCVRVNEVGQPQTCTVACDARSPAVKLLTF